MLWSFEGLGQSLKDVFRVVENQTFLHYHIFRQVQAPKKPTKPKAEDQSKEVEPQTWTQKTAAALPVLLKEAADARTASIKLHGMEYATELSGQLLDHAKKLESLYQDMSKAVTDHAEDKRLKDLVARMNDLDLFGRKAQAPTGLSLHTSASQLLSEDSLSSS